MTIDTLAAADTQATTDLHVTSFVELPSPARFVRSCR